MQIIVLVLCNKWIVWLISHKLFLLFSFKVVLFSPGMKRKTKPYVLRDVDARKIFKSSTKPLLGQNYVEIPVTLGCVCVCVCVPVSVFASQRGKSTIKSLVYLECLELMCIQGTIKPAVMSFKVSNPSWVSKLSYGLTIQIVCVPSVSTRSVNFSLKLILPCLSEKINTEEFPRLK